MRYAATLISPPKKKRHAELWHRPHQNPHSPPSINNARIREKYAIPPPSTAFYHPAYDHEEYPSELIDNDILLFPSDQNTQNPRRKGIKYWLFKTTTEFGNPFEPIARSRRPYQ